MFAIIAALCFLGALLKLSLGSVDLVVLGWLFVALHLALGPVIALPAIGRHRD
jgi:hypothetical protein